MTLAIESADTALVLSERGRDLEVLVLAPHPVAPGDSHGPRQLEARWKGHRLEATAVDARGGKVRETYELAQEGKQLVVVTRVEPRSGSAIQLRRIYLRSEGE